MSSAQNYHYGDQNNSQYLGSDGYCYYDWYRPSSFAKSRSVLDNGGQLKLQARYQWMGSGEVPFIQNKTGEHAILAFTQQTMQASLSCPQKGTTEELKNSLRHPVRQWLHRYGAGVLLSPKGLHIELWNGDGTAYTWSQFNGRCNVHIPTGQVGNLCLGSQPNQISYITNNSNPNFKIQKGSYYWLRQTLTGNPDGKNGWTRLKAELVLDTGFSATLIQEGQIDFITGQIGRASCRETE